MSLKFKETELSGVYLIESEIYKDSRGYFLELNKSAFFEENGIRYNFVQDNISVSKKGALRGIHFQKEPFEQAKLVTVLSGSIYDVVVDLRPNSSNFSKYYGIELSSRKYCSLYIPEGFGHGFCSLEENTMVFYKNSNLYNKDSEAGIIWNDPNLKIDWPISNPLLSEKDLSLPTFKNSVLDII